MDNEIYDRKHCHAGCKLVLRKVQTKQIRRDNDETKESVPGVPGVPGTECKVV